MEIVVLNSDIARLVLGYLKNQQLDSASHTFCKTSPHLRQEFHAFKQGLQPHSFFPNLEEIIGEYVKITRKVEQLLPLLPNALRLQLQQTKLSDKVIKILDHAQQTLLREGEDAKTENDSKAVNSSNCIIAKGKVQSDKENNINEQSKRKRNNDTSTEEKKPRQLGYAATKAKRRRLAAPFEPFFFLSTKGNVTNSSITYDETTESESVAEELDNSDDDDASTTVDEDKEVDLSAIDKPTKESTPHKRSCPSSFVPPSLQDMSQALLENSEFQMKLVDNINQVLHSNIDAQQIVVPITTQSVNAEEQAIISSNSLLDEMIKRILDATEKDPTFDTIIDEVVDASNKSDNPGSVQYNLDVCQHPATIFDCTENLPAPPPPTSLTIPPPRTPLIIRTAVAAATTSAANNELDPISTHSAANSSFGSLIDPNFSISKLIVLNSNESAQKNPLDPNTTIGNTTADHLLNQLTSAADASSLDDQVCFDASTGQLTFPLFLTNDGLLTNFPFLINNEVVTQQLQSDNIVNMDAGRIEIPLAEPIIVSADQLPPNSIILGSVQKLPPTDNQQASTSQQQHQQQVEQTAQRTVCKAKDISISMIVPSSLDSRLNIERMTPSASGIVNAKAYKSLSTPRKRASHVRTLTFSPLSSAAPTILADATPLSTRRAQMSRLNRMPKTVVEEEHNIGALVSEKPIIKNVEILPRLSTAGTAVSLENSANESSNSCSVPPLFAGDESSNLTVIRGDSSIKEKSIIKAIKPGRVECVDTPKRKQQRRAAVRGCKRQLSKSSNEEEDEVMEQLENKTKQNTEVVCGESVETKADINAEATKENNEQAEEKFKENAGEEKDKMMQEWMRMRNSTKNDLDSRLRELNAKSVGNNPVRKEATRKKGRRKRRKLNESLKNKSSENFVENIDKTDDSTSKIMPDDLEDSKLTELNVSDPNETLKVEKTLRETIQHKEKERKRISKDKSKEFNIKIPTPQKSNSNEKTKGKRVGEREMKCDAKFKQDVSAESVFAPETLNATDDNVFSMPSTQTNDAAAHNPVETHHLAYEREKRSANIACLLETPFKEANTCNSIPPTPGVFLPSLEETPLSKMRIPDASFLFGSLTKSELNTPLLTAITPGFGLTPFSSFKDATPRSISGITEYSSGGSYYRPDESDDIDRNIDKMLRIPMRCQEEKPSPANIPIKERNCEISEVNPNVSPTTATMMESVCVEIPAEKLKVEPIVLKRVKSFGSEVAGNTNIVKAPAAAARIEPHYTLASGLPEISAAEDELSSSSSETSSSSSATCSSSTSFSSSKTSSTSRTDITTHAAVFDKSPQKALSSAISLDNLSTISSTEDEEWQKLAETGGEDSQLVSNDGEVRYPVRSWLTPSKENAMATASTSSTTIKVTFPLKSTEKRNRQLNELELKRQRIKEKLRLDKEQAEAEAVLKPAPKAITRKLINTRKPQVRKAVKTALTLQKSRTKKIDVAEENCAIDVLTALNLSAKKQPSVAGSTSVESKVPPLLGEIDDNAVSNIFANVNSTTNNNTATSSPTEAKMLTTSPKTTIPVTVTGAQRKCLPTEALPAIRKKNNPRTPLTRKTTKGQQARTRKTAAATANKVVKTAAAEKIVAATRCSAADDSGDDIDADDGDTATTKKSPVPKIKITAPSCSAAANKVRVSARLEKEKKVSKEATSKKITSDYIKNKPIKQTTKKLSIVVKRLQWNKKTAATVADTIEVLKSQKTEQKSLKPKIKPKDKKTTEKEKKILSKNNTNAAQEIVSTTLETIQKIATTTTSNTIDDRRSVEENEARTFDLVRFTEADTKHFISIVYEGADGKPKEKAPQYDLSNFKMNVAFSEDETHTWTISDEICLYRSESVLLATPTPNKESTAAIRNIPKKRKIRISTTSEDTDGTEKSTTKDVAKLFTVASTPVQTIVDTEANDTKATKTESAIIINTKSQNAENAEDRKSSHITESKTHSHTAANADEKIHIEDIEKILSHLHGTKF